MSINYKLYKAPESELKRLLEFHQNVANDSHARISDIQSILASRKAARDYRRRLEQYAHRYEAAACETPPKDLIAQIVHDLSCSARYASEVAEIALKTMRKERRAKRDAQIRLLSEYMSKTELALKFGISRQQVHNILKS